MTMDPLTEALPALLDELVNGSPDPRRPTYMLNRGDVGLLASLEEISASGANMSVDGAGSSVAAHVDHLRYGFSLLNRWAAGEAEPWKDADWTKSWQTIVLGEEQWRALRAALAAEASAWLRVLRSPPALDDTSLKWVMGTVPHLAYHLGAIRQINRASRGPTAEDERAYQGSSSSS